MNTDIKALAELYAGLRAQEKSLQEAIDGDPDVQEAARDVEAAKTAWEEAKQRHKEVVETHPEALAQAGLATDLAEVKEKLTAQWLQDPAKKTIQCPQGTVTLRVTRSVQVADPVAAIQSIQSRDLYGFVKKLDVSKDALALIDNGGIEGLKATQSASLAYTGV